MKPARSWIDWTALAVGIGAVASSLTVSSTRAGEGLAFGFAAFIAFFGLLSLLVRNRAPDHWGLLVIGLAMFVLPWLASGFAVDRGAAWTCWVAGILAMALGGVGWVTDRPPTETGINKISTPVTGRSALSFWLGRAALVVGIATVVLGATVHSSVAGTATTIGFGAMTAVIALWSLLAVDPTHDFLTLAVFGFALFLAPWVGGFAGDGAARTAWVSGAIATSLGVGGYLRGESLDFSRTAREDAEARYRQRFR
jgi:SPW repeat